MTRWLIAFDLDDSLLMENGAVHEKLKFKLRELQKNDNVLLFASGRSDYSITNVISTIGLNEENIYTSAYNGALLKYGRKEIFSEKLKQEDIKKLMNYIYTNDLYAQSYIDEFIVYETENEYTEIEQNITGQQKKKVKSLMEASQSYPKLMGLGHPSLIREVLDNTTNDLKNDYNITITKPYFLEMMKKNISKAKSVNLIIDREKIDHKKTMAFGDSHNDIQMLEAVSINVAVDNAIKEVKDVCNFKTLSNNDNGIYEFLINFKDWS
ncbi:Cof-type HAD-IIB family hydrolase [Salinicoccus halodurans]|uniref:Haloacid dehalogenase n=1 Tax=Salinicoccus halodurans TaxID=407035 RepID=A0A0F7HIY4_9STAP|nr:Cof-type HAD-IIB family hydrolase [Salinicoccus halodurans]AKG73489.1 hypothetical protein AAT16_04220 [Salinicoccus halodurans]SFK51382.1 hypothetical protein SAMN05216235_0081 [Salinicoccus halodurans]